MTHPQDYQGSQTDWSRNKTEWFLGRIETLLRHFGSFRPGETAVRDAMLEDWQTALRPFPQAAIDHAVTAYLRDRKHPPRPAEIRAMCEAWVERERSKAGKPRPQRGDRSTLSADELQTLDRVLSTARRWRDEGPADLRGHGLKTLAYWGEG